MVERQTACPNPGCGATDTQQRHASSAELIKAGVEGKWVYHAQICSMCGCIYEADNKATHGFLDDAAGKGWSPVENHALRSK